MSVIQEIVLGAIVLIILFFFVVSACAEQDRKHDIENRLRDLERKVK